MTKYNLLAYGLTPDSLVWRPGMHEWVAAYTVPELMEMLRQPGQSADSSAEAGKSRIPAGILAILLGGLGLQYFYCGKIAGGFLTILLTVITCGLWSTLMLAQGIYMLTLTDAEFNRKYVDTTSTLPLF